MNKLTAAQVWYVTQVYPEFITDEEARPDYERRVTGDDRVFWESAAKILNRAAGVTP